MRQIRCPYCGGNLEFLSHLGYYHCTFCGCDYEGDGVDLDEEDVKDLDCANARRNDYSFDEALKYCEAVLARRPDDPEANFCALLAKYKIIYIASGGREKRYSATFLDPETPEPITESEYYRRLSEPLKLRADEIEKKRLAVCREYRHVQNYDVFLCYKRETLDGTGRLTPEAHWAREIYEDLSEGCGYRVFFAEESLSGNPERWDSVIYSALRSARIMLVVGSSVENVDAPWVKNEWKRYGAMQKEDPSKKLLFVGPADRNGRVDPAVIDGLALELRAAQAIGIDPLDKKKGTALLRQAVKTCYGSDEGRIEDLLLKGDAAIAEDGNFKKADKIFREVIDFDVRNHRAYWGRLRCLYRAMDDYDVVKSRKKVDQTEFFLRAAEYAQASGDEEALAHYRNVEQAQLRHDKAAFKMSRANREAYRKKTKKARIAKRICAAVCAAAVLAVGVYGYRGYTHPLNYSVAGNRATLESRSFLFELTSSGELTVDSYDGTPVVAVGEGALEGSKLQTVKLAPSVRTIGDRAFKDCLFLTSFTALGETHELGAEVFAGCTELSSVSFGSSEYVAVDDETTETALSVGEGAFRGCVSLEEISLKGVSSLGKGAFEGCTDLKRVVLDFAEGAEIVTGAFNGTPRGLTLLLPSVEETKAVALAREYPDLSFESYTRDKVEEAVYFIDKIGEIDAASLPAIEKAESLYGALSSAERARVTNASSLRDARAVYTAVSFIDAIGTVSLGDETPILAAESAYRSLTDVQRARVGNYGELVDARAAFDVMKLIADVGTVSVQSKSLIERAENAYGALTEAQKRMISNYSVLQEARNAYSVCLAIDCINAIGTVSDLSGSAIEAAEAAYRALPAELRSRVTNYDVLSEARTIYDVIVAIGKLETVSPASGPDIANAEALYGALAADRKAKVSNYSLLEGVRSLYDAVLAIDAVDDVVTAQSRAAIENAEQAVKALGTSKQSRLSNYGLLVDARAAYEVVVRIDAIGSVSIGSGKAIEEANEAYGRLSAAQRRRVGNYATLTAATEEFEICEVTDLIEKLGTVTLQSRDRIEAAEAAYRSLSAAQRAKVENYDKLKAVRNIFDALLFVQNFGRICLGTNASYNYREITAANAESVLNDESVRSLIENLTVFGLSNVSSLQWKAIFPHLSRIRYDITATEDLPSTFAFAPSEVGYSVIGATSRTYEIAFATTQCSAVSVSFENVSLSAKNLPIDLSGAEKATLFFYGTNKISSTEADSTVIQGNDVDVTLSNTVTAVSAATGGIGLKCSTLTVGETLGSSLSVLTIAGGNGKNSENPASKGTDGGSGVVSTGSVSIDVRGTVNIYGGNGGNGCNGTAGTQGETGGSGSGDVRGKQGGSGTNGGNASDGGKGASALIAKNSVAIDSGTCNFVGGNGGDGGKGGVGGKGGTGGSHHPSGLLAGGGAGNGGTGGTGGNGGKGGLGYAAIQATRLDVSGGSVAIQNGNGGKGGDGGDGGQGGTGGNAQAAGIICGYAGGGGSGGQGGSGGTGGNATSMTAVVSDGSGLTIAKGSGGQGGALGHGGKVGSKGTAGLYGGSFASGKAGTDGQTGSNGKIV